MAKNPKKPAPKRGGKKNAVPKKVVLKSRQHGKSAAAHKPREFSREERAPHPTVEEQFAADYAAETARRQANETLFGGPGKVLAKTTFTPKPSFWTRFQSSENGRFVSAAKALADKARTFGRRVLRKPAP